MDNKLYELVSQWYFGNNLPKVLPTKRGQLIKDRSGESVSVGDEIDGLRSFRAFYDSEKLLRKIPDVSTRPRTSEETIDKVRDLEELVRVIDTSKLANNKDLTHYFSHETQNMVTTTSPVKNYYSDVDEDECIQYGVPDDFLAPNATLSKGAVGKGFGAFLVNTKHFANQEHPVGAVLAKASQYIIGGKVVNLREGRVIEERFATTYDPVHKVLEIEHRTYDMNMKPTSQKEFFDYKRPELGIQNGSQTRSYSLRDRPIRQPGYAAIKEGAY
jgi:hypothetical protein